MTAAGCFASVKVKRGKYPDSFQDMVKPSNARNFVQFWKESDHFRRKDRRPRQSRTGPHQKEDALASSLTRKIPTILGALLLAATLFTAYTATMAQADHMPADKVAAAGTTIERLENTAEPILQETMKVSSPTDLILSVTAECSILTALDTEGSTADNAQDTESTEGTVEIWVTIDGTIVPVASTAAGAPAERPDGKVVFCNRAYERTIQDVESSNDGYDSERDFIRTRTANAFNWMAINSGTYYDEGNDNILNIAVWATYTDSTPAGERCSEATADPAAFMTCSEAFVGQRTLIVEPTKLSVHEQVTPVEGDSSPAKGKRP